MSGTRKAPATDPDDQQAAVRAQLKDQKKDDTIEVSAAEAPVSPVAAADDRVAALQDELEEARAALAKAEAQLAAARSASGAGLVEVDLESGAPKWVQQVSGMARKDIAGYVALPGNVLIVKDKQGREGHRFTYLDRQRDDRS